MSTKVRLTDAEYFPQHGPGLPILEDPHPGDRLWPKYRGTVITIGAPVKPQGWECGTDVVWPVIQCDAFGEGPAPENAFVCRHQIQAGD